MHKFIIKHRNKRKYIKKTKIIHSFSLSKAIFGMMPLIIMLVAFMTTLVISAPLRNSLSTIRVTFQMPDFSLVIPFAVINNIFQEMNHGMLHVGTITNTIFAGFAKFAPLIEGGVFRLIQLLDPLPFYSFTSRSLISLSLVIWSFNGAILQSIQILFVLLVHNLLMIGNFVVTIIQRTSSILLNTLDMTGQMMITTVTAIGNDLVSFAEIIVHFFVSVFLVIYQLLLNTAIIITQALLSTAEICIHFLIVLTQILWTGLLFTIRTITEAINHAVNTIIYYIEMPFKNIYAFWLVMKPYVDIFNRHIRMTGNDLSNGFASLGNFGNLINAKQ